MCSTKAADILRRFQMSLVSNKIFFDLGWSVAGEISDDHWDVVRPQHIAAWKQALTALETGKVWFGNDMYEFMIDWSPVIVALTHSYEETKKLYSTDPPKYADARFSYEPVNINIRISHVFKAKIMPIERVAEHILIDMFAVMNFASPSSFNLHNARTQTKRGVGGEPFRLSCNQFEIALLNSLAGKWPNIEALPVEQCSIWFRSVRSRNGMFPQSRMERVIFALLHLSRGDIDPARIVWLFYAFEALFDTKIGENFRSLVERIALLITPSEIQNKYLRRTMRDLYDLRSSFVHGGMEVFHPFADSLHDKAVEAAYGRLMTSCDRGFQVLLACIQEVIRRQWKEPEFAEVVSGARIIPHSHSIVPGGFDVTS
jgi:hypothetical protein